MQTLVLIFILVILLFSIIIHECAHGLVAEHYGDSTAREMGRITLNPIPHLDLIGSLLLPGMMILMSLMGHSTPVIFGWAKPVPVDSRNLANPRQDNLWIALAGPASNLLCALLIGFIARAAMAFLPLSGSGLIIIKMLLWGVWINIILMVFNLLPLPPLDGYHILEGLVSRETYFKLQSFARVGQILLLGLVLLTIFAHIDFFWILFQPFLAVLTPLFAGLPLNKFLYILYNL